jgi:hypothetical protein
MVEFYRYCDGGMESASKASQSRVSDSDRPRTLVLMTMLDTWSSTHGIFARLCECEANHRVSYKSMLQTRCFLSQQRISSVWRRKLQLIIHSSFTEYYSLSQIVIQSFQKRPTTTSYQQNSTRAECTVNSVRQFPSTQCRLCSHILSETETRAGRGDFIREKRTFVSKSFSQTIFPSFRACYGNRRSQFDEL